MTGHSQPVDPLVPTDADPDLPGDTARGRAKMPVPDGTIPVAIALLIAGIATFAFFRIGTVAVGGEEEFTPIVALWFATFALTPGFFLPLEQELGRALAHRRATHDGSAPVVRKVGSAQRRARRGDRHRDSGGESPASRATTSTATG